VTGAVENEHSGFCAYRSGRGPSQNGVLREDRARKPEEGTCLWRMCGPFRGWSTGIAVRAMDADRCRATVTLDEPLRRSLGSWSGETGLAHVHSCVLQGSHHGQHRAMANPDDRRGWFRWDDLGFRLGVADASRRAQRGDQERSPRHAGSAARSSGAGSAAATTNLTTPRPRRGRHAADANAPYRSPEPRSPTGALWAIATALERLADVIAAASA
jgi:hypothetical protein